MIDKAQLREKQVTQLTDLAPDDRSQQTARLHQQLFATDAWKQSNTVAVTLSNPLEVATRPIIEQAWQDKKQVVIPLTLPKRQMAFVTYTVSSQLELSKFHVWEPLASAPRVNKQTIDLMIVPGLAYSLDNNARVGFGGGYYDRFLSDFSGKKIALALKPMEFQTAIWQIDTFDVLLDKIITVEEVGE